MVRQVVLGRGRRLPARPNAAGNRAAQETVLTQIARLQTLTHPELQDKWRELYEAPPPQVWNRAFLLRRLAYRIQELAFGGLPEETRRELERIAALEAKLARKDEVLGALMEELVARRKAEGELKGA